MFSSSRKWWSSNTSKTATQRPPYQNDTKANASRKEVTGAALLMLAVIKGSAAAKHTHQDMHVFPLRDLLTLV